MGDNAAPTSPSGAMHLKTEDTDPTATHATTDHSPRANKVPSTHSRGSSRDTAPRTWTQNNAVAAPDRLRGQAAAARSPSVSSQRSQKYYRMALVSAIQPSFGTDASSMNQGDEERKREEDGGRTAPGQGGS